MCLICTSVSVYRYGELCKAQRAPAEDSAIQIFIIIIIVVVVAAAADVIVCVCARARARVCVCVCFTESANIRKRYLRHERKFIFVCLLFGLLLFVPVVDFFLQSSQP